MNPCNSSVAECKPNSESENGFDCICPDGYTGDCDFCEGMYNMKQYFLKPSPEFGKTEQFFIGTREHRETFIGTISKAHI